MTIKILISLLCALTALTTSAQITNGLMAYYPCEGNFNDASGAGLHGTVTGAVPGPDRVGNPTGAYLFDGVDDYVSLPNIGAYTSFTLMTRIKFTSTALMNIFGGQNAGMYPSVSNGKVAWYDVGTWRYSTSVINNNQWHTVAYVFNNTNYSIYVDGNIEYTGAGGPSITDGLMMSIARSSTPDRYFNGSLDEIRIYNRPLTANEINIAFNGYPVAWTEVKDMTVNADNSLSKTSGTASYDAGAASYNLLPEGQNGWIQYTHSGGHYSVMLSVFNNNYSYVGTHGVFTSNGGLYVLDNNSNNTGSMAVGDVIRIDRIGTQINYYKNGVLIFSKATINTRALRVDVSCAITRVPAVFTSFDRVISLQPTFTTPGLANNDGGITVNPAGGDAPYSYQWSSGETTASIATKARGSYSLTVTDAAGRTISRTYTLGFATTWSNIKNYTLNADGTLTKSVGGTAWDTGAGSLNVISPGTDGWFEFVWGDEGDYMIDLRTYDVGPFYYFPSRAINMVSTGSLNIYEGNLLASTLYPIKGDVIRIARESGIIKYYRNGVVLRTNSLDTNAPILLDLLSQAGSVPLIYASHDKQIKTIPSFLFPDNANQNGAITPVIEGAHTPVTTSWSNGEQTQTINGKSRGTYSLTINDAATRTLTRSYKLGYPIQWTDFYFTALNSDNTLYRSGGTADWGSAAVSSNMLVPNTDGWIEFVVGKQNAIYMMGLTTLNSIADINSISYAFYFSDGSLSIFEAGANFGAVAYAPEGTVLRISREGSNIKYYVNDNVVRTRSTASSLKLIVDCTISRVIVGAANPLPTVSASFPDQPETYYSIANGNWNSGNTWSLTEGGPPAQSYPGSTDVVNIKGYTVTVNSGVRCTTVNIIVTNQNTALKIDGAGSILTTTGGAVTIKGENNLDTVNALIVQNNGKISVAP